MMKQPRAGRSGDKDWQSDCRPVHMTVMDDEAKSIPPKKRGY